MAVKKTTAKAPAKKPAAPKGKVINKAGATRQLPPSYYSPSGKKGRDIPIE